MVSASCRGVSGLVVGSDVCGGAAHGVGICSGLVVGWSLMLCGSCREGVGVAGCSSWPWRSLCRGVGQLVVVLLFVVSWRLCVPSVGVWAACGASPPA